MELPLSYSRHRKHSSSISKSKLKLPYDWEDMTPKERSEYKTALCNCTKPHDGEKCRYAHPNNGGKRAFCDGCKEGKTLNNHFCLKFTSVA